MRPSDQIWPLSTTLLMLFVLPYAIYEWSLRWKPGPPQFWDLKFFLLLWYSIGWQIAKYLKNTSIFRRFLTFGWFRFKIRIWTSYLSIVMQTTMNTDIDMKPLTIGNSQRWYNVVEYSDSMYLCGKSFAFSSIRVK